MSLVNTEPDPWERAGESPSAWQAFQIYRDMAPGNRTLRAAAMELHKSVRLLEQWSVRHGWVARVAAWDREQDRIALQARKEEIARINTLHATIAEEMLLTARSKIPAAGAQLARQPHALSEWVKTATKAQRDAAGIADPAKTTIVAGDPDNPIQHDVDIAGVFSSMPPELVLKARELSIEWTKAQAREQAGLPPAPPKEEPTTEA